MSEDEYTPTTEEIREYVEIGGEPRPWEPPNRAMDDKRAAAFDRWLAQTIATETEALRAEVAQMGTDVTFWQDQTEAAEAEMDRLMTERDLAVAHDTQPYPTAWAYEQACKALEDQRTRADAAEAKIAAVEALLVEYGDDDGGWCDSAEDAWRFYRDLRAALTDEERS